MVCVACSRGGGGISVGSHAVLPQQAQRTPGAARSPCKQKGGVGKDMPAWHFQKETGFATSCAPPAKYQSTASQALIRWKNRVPSNLPLQLSPYPCSLSPASTPACTCCGRGGWQEATRLAVRAGGGQPAARGAAAPCKAGGRAAGQQAGLLGCTVQCTTKLLGLRCPSCTSCTLQPPGRPAPLATPHGAAPPETSHPAPPPLPGRLPAPLACDAGHVRGVGGGHVAGRGALPALQLQRGQQDLGICGHLQVAEPHLADHLQGRKSAHRGAGWG